MQKEKVSVIIPTYNRAHLIGRSIESVRDQGYRELEILIVDDGSEDNTEEVVRSIADDRIRYIRQSENRGAAAARNAGAAQAVGEWVAFQDSDDVWRAEKLMKQMAYHRENPACDMIYCAYLMHAQDVEIRIPGETEGSGTPLADAGEDALFESLLMKNRIGTPTMLVRKERFLSSGGFDVSYRSLEDWEFALRFSEKYKIGYVDEILVDAYSTQDGVSSAAGAHFETRCRMIAGYRDKLIRKNMFDRAVLDLFAQAEKNGVLEQVKQMLILCLQKA